MSLFYIILLSIIIYGIIVNRHEHKYNYLDKDTCNAIKGVFICIVFLRHIYPYMAENGYAFPSFLDKSFLIIDTHIGQLLVVMFLFYSGYGVMESIKKKGIPYIKSFPYKRIFVTWINFVVALLFFFLIDLLLERPITIKQTLLSLVCWDSLGNSNWYFFAILSCYIFTYLAFRYIKSSRISPESVVLIALLFNNGLDLPTSFYHSLYPVAIYARVRIQL